MAYPLALCLAAMLFMSGLEKAYAQGKGTLESESESDLSGDSIEDELMHFRHLLRKRALEGESESDLSGDGQSDFSGDDKSDFSGDDKSDFSGDDQSGDGSGDEACSALDCTENEMCMTLTGIQGCGCLNYNPEPDSSFDASEICGSSSGSLSLSRCQLFEAGFPEDLLHLNDPTCKGQVENGRVNFDIAPHSCGTTLTSNETHFLLENAVQYFSSAKRSVVSRDSWLNVNFSCAYPLIQSLSMPMSIRATGGVVYKNLPSGEGTYQIHMVPYPNASFITPYSGNITLDVNQQVYVAVDLDGFDSNDIATVLDNCWATPTSDMNDNVRWNLITNECPNPKDGTVQILQNGVSTSSHFSFRMFAFTGVSQNIYLHCKVHLCLQVGGDCTLPCDDDGDHDEGRKRRSLDFHDTAHISMGF